MHAGRVKPVPIKRHSELLHADVLRIVAYRAVCPCGYSGPSRDTHAEARGDLRAHARTAPDTRRENHEHTRA